VAGAQRLAGRRRRAGGDRNGSGGRRRAPVRVASSRQTAAGGASTAARAGCGATRPRVADDRDRVRVRKAPRRVRRLAEDRRTDDEQRVVRRELLAQRGRSAGGSPRTADDPAGTRARAERLLEDGDDEPLGELDERAHVSRRPRRRHDERRRLAPCEKLPRARRRRADRRRARRTTRRRVLALLLGRRLQSSIGTITSAGPRCVAAAWYARSIAPGTSCAATGCSTDTG
jgi:hypothetical protein